MTCFFALDLSRAVDPCEPIIADAVGLDTGMLRLDTVSRETIRRLSGVARAGQAALGACLGALAASGALAGHDIERDNLAVITVGWRLHVPTSWSFAERALTAGAGLVNPLQFPHVLPSACAVTIAATIGSHGPAFGMECSAEPVASAVAQAEAMIEAGYCSAALVVVVFDASKFTDWTAAPWQHWPDKADGAFAALVGVGDRGYPAERSASSLDQFLSRICNKNQTSSC
jgi:3-oxoacyl-(acyl-carrier-protein) synthase